MKTTRPLAVITGASKGIGLELARVFAKNGHDLVINSNSDKLHEAVADLKNYGVEVKGVRADLSTREGADTLYKNIDRNIDVLVLNAGVGVGGEFISNEFDDELKLMNLNMVNVVYLTKKVLQDMVIRNEGKILFTSSVAAEMPAPYNAVYAASKAFIQSFSQALRYEMKDTDKNITITSLQPGATDTDFFERADLQDSPMGKMSKDSPAKVAQDGYEALMKDKGHVVAGSLKNKIQIGLSKLIPEEVRTKIHGKLSKPDSLNH